ncbi:MAG: hypothetical protein JW894_09060 [Bacteroidales bacterium]|nr:hypothetical protein [Bacteroidales bacterium]
MKVFKILIFCAIIPLSCFSQDDDFQTIFKKKDDKRLRISGFGGPVMIFTSTGNDFAHMMGGYAAVIVGNTFFGGYGMGKTNKTPFKGNNEYNLNFGHGGLMFGAVAGYKKPVHFSFSSLIGWGSISESLSLPDFESENINSYPVFVITPVIELEFNFSRYFVLGAGTSVSYVTGRGITDTDYTREDFFKPAVFMSFKFGWFK